MKTIKFFAAALAIVAAASCVKENNPDNVGHDNEITDYLPEITLSASFAQPDSKSTLKDNKPHWESSDRICVFPYNPSSTDQYDFSPYDGAYFTIDEFEEDFARFTGSPKAVNYTTIDVYGAIFPGESFLDLLSTYTNYNKWYFTSNTLAIQTAVLGDFPLASFPSSAATANISVALTSAKNEMLSFENINALLKFTVAKPGIRTIEVSAESATNSERSGMGADANLGGRIIYYPHAEDEVRMGLSGDTPITFTNGSSDFTVGGTYYVAIPAVLMSGLTVTLKDASGNVLHTFTKASDFTAKPNNIYDLGSFNWPSVGDYFYTDGTYSTELNTNKTVAGVIFWVGDPTADDENLKRDYPNCTHGLVVGYKNDGKYEGAVSANGAWGTEYAYFSNTGAAINTKYDPYYKKTGYTNTQKLKTAQPNANAITICNGLTTVTKASSWYMPTIAEFDELVANVAIVNDTFASYNTYCYNKSAVIYPGSSGLFTVRGNCWTVSEDKGGANYAARYKFDTNSYDSPPKTSFSNIRPIFAF